MGAIDPLHIAAEVRNACVLAALDAYEHAQIAGLCQEGAWEVAVDAMRTLDVKALVENMSIDTGVTSPTDGRQSV